MNKDKYIALEKKYKLEKERSEMFAKMNGDLSDFIHDLKCCGNCQNHQKNKTFCSKSKRINMVCEDWNHDRKTQKERTE